MAYIGRPSIVGNFVKLDAITAVNGQAAYTMQNNSVNFTDYSTVNQFLVSLNGTIQSPGSSFTVSGSTLTFASNLSTGDVIDFVIVFGNSLSAGVPTDDTVSTAKIVDGAVTNSKVASSIINSQTAETSIADADEVLIYDSSASALRKMTKANFVSGVGGDNTPAFKAHFSGNVSVGAGSDTVATFNSEDFDTDNAFNTSTYRFIPQTAGKYYLYVNIQVASATNGNLYVVYIRKNGNFVGRGWHIPGASQTLSLKAYTTQTANGSTDYFDVVYYFADAKTANGGSDESEFGGYKLIGV